MHADYIFDDKSSESLRCYSWLFWKLWLQRKVWITTSIFSAHRGVHSCIVIYRHAILEVDGVESLPDIPFIVTEHFFVISPDDKHDQFFTEKVQNIIRDYLDSI